MKSEYGKGSLQKGFERMGSRDEVVVTWSGDGQSRE